MTSALGPAAIRNEPAGTVHEERPPGKYSLPVIPVRISAAARLNVPGPRYIPSGCHERTAQLVGHPRAECIQATREAVGSVASRCQARSAILPSFPLRAAIAPPLAVLSFVMSSISPGTSGRPSLLYAAADGSLDWPRLAM